MTTHHAPIEFVDGNPNGTSHVNGQVAPT